MKKTRKGLTLVEVIVAIAVFTIISLALFSSYLGMRKVVFRQEEYARLEMVCYDINYYWDKYGDESNDQSNDQWYKKYFGPDANKNKGYLKYENGKLVPQASDQNADYEISWSYYSINSDGNVESYLDGKTKCLKIDSIKSSDGKHTFINSDKPVYCGPKEGN